ncbi:MAG: DUF4373 domain-containing protein [Candidatus Kapabacteria bacterium]|nr:DUF4373 domain-containing protein [Candidatus Kapabacteria bacterium]
MKEAYYFSHDTNARNDEKILCLRADYGITGYGAFWILIEMMFENQDTQLSHKHVKGIAYSLNMEVELLTNIINSCVEYGLFVSDGDNFWSESLRTRKGTYINKREKKVEAGLKSAEARRLKALENSEQTSNFAEQDSNLAQTNGNYAKALLEQNSNTSDVMFEQNLNSVSTELNSEPTKSNKLKEIKVKEKEIFNSSPPKSEISEEGKEYANFFKGLLPPTQKVTEADLKNWADTFDKLVRIDKRSMDEVYQVTEWARKDSFWGEQGNFLSACKLRNKSKDGVLYYDIFLQKFNQERSRNNGTNSGQQIQRPDWIKAKE